MNAVPANKIKFPKTVNDYILYSYGSANVSPAFVDATLATDPISGGLTCFYDSENPFALQPSNSPFGINGNFLSTSYAQAPFAKLISNIGYEHIITFVGGEITYNKTILVSNLLSRTAVNSASNSSPAVLVMRGITTISYSGSAVYNNLGNGLFQISGKIDNQISGGEAYYQFQFGNYVVLDANNKPIAILELGTNFPLTSLVGSNQLIIGVVDSVLWDTRIPVQTYRMGSPVFQVSNNFSADTIPLIPDLSLGNYHNQNFLVQIQGFPLGNQQSITASWTFNIEPLAFSSGSGVGFSDVKINNAVTSGVMSTYTGRNTGTFLGSGYLDWDNASYEQDYLSPSFNAYFIDYYDYVNMFCSEFVGVKTFPTGSEASPSSIATQIFAPFADQ